MHPTEGTGSVFLPLGAAQLLMQRAVVSYLYAWSWCVVRRRGPFIIGVTGSAGKTTTVEMIAAVLQHEDARQVVGNVSFTRHNMNCDRGLPLTILRYDDWIKSTTIARLKLYLMAPLRALKLMTVASYPDVLVLEYGAGPGGRLRMLSRLARPDIAVVTTIGPAHLEHMKTVDSVAKEKGALVQAVPPTGLVILGQEHDHVRQLEALARAPVVKLQGRGLELSNRIAHAIARYLEVPDVTTDAALGSFQPPEGRLRLWRMDHLTLIDDSFNANPLSMKLGLETLRATAPAGVRRVAILGEMAELGGESTRFHREIGDIARHHAHFIVGVGEFAQQYQPDQWYPTSRSCAERVDQLLRTGDCVLVKGSHAVHMRQLVHALRKLGTDGIRPDRARLD